MRVGKRQDRNRPLFDNLGLTDALGRAAFTTDRFATGATVDANGTLFKSVAPDAAQLTSSRRLSSTGTAYDDQGRVKETKDAAGLVTQTEYYDNGQVKRTRTVASGVPSPWTSYDYDRTDALPAGTVSYDSVTDANGHTTKTYKDAIGRVVKTLYADGSFADVAYGPFGSVTQTYDQRKASDPSIPTYTERQYDLSGRLTDVYLPAVTDADPSSATFNQSVRPHWVYAYDATGNETGRLDPKGRLTTFGYDDYGNRTSRTLPPDSDGNLANDTEYWTYDAFGRTATHTDFKGQSTRYVYDDAPARGGRLTEEQRFTGAVDTTPDEKTVYGYDDLGRQSSVDEYAGTTLARHTATAYDPVTGGTTQVASPEGILNHAYDPATGRLTRTWTAGNDTAYQYDGQGRLWKVVVTRYNGVTLTTPLATTYAYDAIGNLLTTTQDEGTPADPSDDLVTTDTYDAMNRLDTLTATVKGVTVFDQDYGYTSDGQKHDVLEHRYNASGTLTSTTRTTWGYDDDGRLTGETRDEGDDHAQNGGDYADTFAFDLSGNRVGKTHDAVGTAGDIVTASAYNDRDELISTQANGGPPQAVTYDPDGNTLTDGPTVYTWDLRNRMLTVTVPTPNGPVTTTYAYDESGVRVSKTTNGTTTAFLNDASNPTGYSKPIEERVNGSLSRTYLIGITVLGQADATGSVTDILRDGRGYARSLVASGVVVQNVDYGGYGDPLNGVTPGTAAASPDGYRDVETGSYYQNARFRLDGHWLSQDDITLSPGDTTDANLFGFVHGDPLNRFDPSGHFELGLAGILGTAGVIGSIAGIGFNGVANYATNQPFFQGGLYAGLFGFGAGILAVASPAFAVGLGAYGVFSSGQLAWRVWNDPTASVGQKAAAFGLFGASIVGGASAVKYYGSGGSVLFRSAAELETAAGSVTEMGGQPQPGLRSIARLPQDVNANAAPPRANGGGSTIGDNPAQNAALGRWLTMLNDIKAADIRVNQQQVNAAGQRVGINRPDLQFTFQDRRWYIEWDGPGSNRGVPHAERTMANDPNGYNLIFRSN